MSAFGQRNTVSVFGYLCPKLICGLSIFYCKDCSTSLHSRYSSNLQLYLLRNEVEQSLLWYRTGQYIIVFFHLSSNCSPCSKFAAKSATDLCEGIQLHSWRFFLSKSVADARKYMAGLKHICVQCTSTHKILTTKWWQQFKHKVCSLLLFSDLLFY